MCSVLIPSIRSKSQNLTAVDSIAVKQVVLIPSIRSKSQNAKIVADCDSKVLVLIPSIRSKSQNRINKILMAYHILSS